MSRSAEPAAARLADFAAVAQPPASARSRAKSAVVDTIGVALAGAAEPAARIVQTFIHSDGSGPARILGTPRSATPAAAAFANGTAAHALDYDDMCFVSLAHPSTVLVPAILAIAEARGRSGAAMLDAYVVGCEIEACLGRTMNPDHYRRGWHCTSTIGVVGAAAAAGRLLDLDRVRMTHAIAIAASSASGLKENFGTMVKPLHAGLAARDAVVAAMLASGGLTGSVHAIDGAQGLRHAMDGESGELDAALKDLGARWEILETGITVKLYPSCAGTHPALDAILDLRRAHGLTDADVDRLEIGVDAVTPTILIHDRPATGLEGKFSMPFCAAAAMVFGAVGLETFEDTARRDARVASLMDRISMRVDESLDRKKPALTEARVTMRLRDGRVLSADAHGARGYPENPPSDDEVRAKFLTCARRTIASDQADRLFDRLGRLEDAASVRDVLAR